VFFRKKLKQVIYDKFEARIPREYTRELAELIDKLNSASPNCNHVIRHALWSKIYSIFPKLKIEAGITFHIENALSYTLSVSAADYFESPFN